MKVTPRLEQAINKATYAHRNQKRKGSELPYIVHPYGVMCIASQVTDDEDILIACLMHDVLEDVPLEYTKEQMVADFGQRVVSIVEGVTKDESLPDWQARQDAYLAHLEHEASDESVIVCCSDKIHNLMSILRDYEELGDDLWTRFNGGREKQLWWYQSVLAITSSRMPDLPLNKQLGKLVSEFEGL